MLDRRSLCAREEMCRKF